MKRDLRWQKSLHYISVISVAKLKNFIVSAFTYVSESFVLLYGVFCMIHIVLTAMKR
jgi:hypothetical protein